MNYYFSQELCFYDDPNYVNTTNNTMLMSLTELDSIKRQIQKRLNKQDITKSERNFLNNLLTINEIENGKDREVKNDKD